MRRVAFVVICLLAGGIGTASAQQRQTPSAWTVAVAADIGLFVPAEGFDISPSFGAVAELYVLPRVSGRARFGTVSTGSTTSDVSLRRTWAALEVVYNWEAGLWHPYAVAGATVVGLHPSGTPSDAGQTRGGVNFGGGIEYFARDKVTVKFEALYSRLASTTVFSPAGVDPSGLSLTVGLKRYF